MKFLYRNDLKFNEKYYLDSIFLFIIVTKWKKVW